MNKTRMFQTDMKPSISGNKIRHKYIKVINENGLPELREIGIEDIQESIDSFKDTVDLNYILDRCTNGHPELVSRLNPDDIATMIGIKKVGGQYLDISDIPTSMIEAYEIIEKAKNYYNNLDNDLKKQYSDFKCFLNGIKNNNINIDINNINEEISNNE